jgi:glyoxylase-like metal-dependent hydrolase (beta-lactamase superfamily II)
MLTKLMPHLFTWAEIHGASRNQGYNWNSFLVQDESRNIRALIDPLPLSASEIQQIDELGGPTHLMLTCAYHERNLTEFKRRWDCEVLLHENQVHEVEFAFNDTFADRDVLWNFVEVVRVPNVRHREEVCFYLRSHGGVLIMGDLLSGGRKDSGIPDGKLGFNAPEYLVDLDKARLSLRMLLHFEFDLICFGHGVPVVRGAKEVLRHFIECDVTWTDLAQKREEGFRLNPELRKLHST